VADHDSPQPRDRRAACGAQAAGARATGEPSGAASDPVWALDARVVAAKALQDLPSAQREVLELAFYEGLSQVEIATRTGTPLGTVKSRTRMALERLRQTFAVKGWAR
jgi:RNA polymerase sigma-70 factor, ECF subfamily